MGNRTSGSAGRPATRFSTAKRAAATMAAARARGQGEALQQSRRRQMLRGRRAADAQARRNNNG